MVKVVTLFLIAMMILAILGRLRLPRFGLNKRACKRRIQTASKCDSCGSYILGADTCDCKNDK